MDLYQHVRVVLSTLVAFGLTRLLSGASQLVQHERKPVYWVHLVWTLYMILYTVAFWWWENSMLTKSVGGVCTLPNNLSRKKTLAGGRSTIPASIVLVRYSSSRGTVVPLALV